MGERHGDEMKKVMQLIQKQNELLMLKNTLNQYEKSKKQLVDEVSLIKDQINRKETQKNELERKTQQQTNTINDITGVRNVSYHARDNATKGKTNHSRDEAYRDQMVGNFHEFDKLKGMFEDQFKHQSELEHAKIMNSREGNNDSEVGTISYVKPSKPVIEVVYWKKRAQEEDNENGKQSERTEASAGQELVLLNRYKSREDGANNGQPEEASNEKVVAASISEFIKYRTTFRIHKDVRYPTLYSAIAGFCKFPLETLKVLDSNRKEIFQKTRTVAEDVENKSPNFIAYDVKSNAGEVLRIEETTKEGEEEGGAEEKNAEDLEAKFLRYLYSLRTFFIIDPKKRENKEVEGAARMDDYHPGFIAMMLFLLLFTIYSVFSFFLQNESTMRSGFTNILSKFRSITLSDIDSVSQVADYIEYLGTDDFKKEIEKNFKFIGLIAVRQVKTRSFSCDIPSKRSNYACYEKDYTEESKYYKPITYTNTSGAANTTAYLLYRTKEQNRIYSIAKGLFSEYDGSGYLLPYHHDYSVFRDTILADFKNMRSVYFQDNTKAVIVNFNLNYPVLNVNVSAEILFEISPLGEVVTNPITLHIFVMDYSHNRPSLYVLDIFLHILNFLYFTLFGIIIMNQQRDLFMDYCTSIEGLLNWSFTFVSLINIVVFIVMMNKSKLSLNRREASEDHLFYYNDFTSYIQSYEFYKLLKSVGICILLIRFSLIIVKSERGRVFIEAVKKVGDKFIFVLLINFGMLISFTVMYCYGVGIYFVEMNTLYKSFVVLTNFTLRNSLFNELSIFDGFTFVLFMVSYLMLISIVGVFLQVIFTDAVRNLFIEYENPVIDVESKTSFMDTLKGIKSKIGDALKGLKNKAMFWKRDQRPEPENS